MRAPVDIEVYPHRLLKASLLVSEDGGDDTVLLPLNLITWSPEAQSRFAHWRRTGMTGRPVLRIAIPEWLASDRGLI